MTSKRLLILTIILFGSLWGLAELWIGESAIPDGFPRAPVQTAAGLLMLVIARRAWGVPGSSLGAAAVASCYKLLQQPVWGCKIVAVLVVGAVFDAGFTFYEARRRARGMRTRARCVTTLSALVAFVSFACFALVARYGLRNPFWMAPARLVDYVLVQGALAVVLAVPAALAGLRLGELLARSSPSWDGARWAAYRAIAAGSTIAGVASAIALRG